MAVARLWGGELPLATMGRNAGGGQAGRLWPSGEGAVKGGLSSGGPEAAQAAPPLKPRQAPPSPAQASPGPRPPKNAPPQEAPQRCRKALKSPQKNLQPALKREQTLNICCKTHFLAEKFAFGEFVL